MGRWMPGTRVGSSNNSNSNSKSNNNSKLCFSRRPLYCRIVGLKVVQYRIPGTEEALY